MQLPTETPDKSFTEISALFEKQVAKQFNDPRLNDAEAIAALTGTIFGTLALVLRKLAAQEGKFINAA